MNQINAKNAYAANDTTYFPAIDGQANEKENTLNVLDEWQLSMVGGGDTIVCW